LTRTRAVAADDTRACGQRERDQRPGGCESEMSFSSDFRIPHLTSLEICDAARMATRLALHAAQISSAITAANPF
jgi:hypothetical protein